MKSIGVRILAGLITFLIGWSCAKLNFFLFSRPSNIDQSKAEKIFDDDSKVEYVEVVSRPDSEFSIPVFSWDGYVRRGKVDVRTGGSTKVVNSVLVSHTKEIDESSDAAAYVLAGLRDNGMRARTLRPRVHFASSRCCIEKTM